MPALGLTGMLKDSSSGQRRLTISYIEEDMQAAHRNTENTRDCGRHDLEDPG